MGLAKILIKKLSKLTKTAFEENKQFFSKPADLVAIGVVGVNLLNHLLEKLKKKHFKNISLDLENQKELLKYLKVNPVANAILNYANNSLDEDYLSEILLACEKGDPKEIDFSSDNYLNNISNDIDYKVNSSRFKDLNNTLAKINGLIELLLPYVLLIIYIINLTKELITKTDHPSKYRLKYIQKLIRTTIGLMKTQGEEKFKEQIDILKQIDTLLITLSLATFLYFKNRKILQNRSRETLKQVVSENTCGTTLEDPIDPEIIPKPLGIPTNMSQFNCPVDSDNSVVPKEPFESKQQNFTCEVFEGTQEYGEANEKFGLANKAILQNNKSADMLPIVEIDDRVDTTTIVATIENNPIFSPVKGYVESFEKNKIIIKEIEDTNEDFLNEQIDSLTKNYQLLNELKLFLNDYYIPSLYPVMLSVSILDDTSINSTENIDKGIAPQYQVTIKKYEAYKKEYDKKIQDITGEANVKKHSENETLDQIKNDIEELQNTFCQNLRFLDKTAKNLSKIIAAKPEEFILLQYYLNTLGKKLNAIKNPNDIEKNYIKKINDIIVKRYFLDKFKLSDIEDKLNDLIKDLEKGVSLGNWFKKLINVYDDAKKDKLDVVKDWLTDIANKNNKLDPQEKIDSVDNIMYLFNFYLQMKSLTGKYQLKKTTSKEETIIEGNDINLYFANLWKEYDQIIIDIEKITKIIDGLSTFTTYSITEINDEPYRLYVLADVPQCDLPDDIKFTPDTGFGSKKYWLKYCAFATLASVTNPATGWATGFPPPIGPIPFPVIYIPIKPIATKWGFIVLGLSICGIYLFPWILFGNLSSDYNTPLGDPTKALKNEIKSLEKDLINQIKGFRRSILKAYLDELKEDIDNKIQEIESTKALIKLNKENKPKRNNSPTTKQRLEYTQKYSQWIETGSALREQLITFKTERWGMEKKYKIVFEAYKLGKSVKGSGDRTEKVEEKINKQFAKLDNMFDKIDNILAPLPITMKPNSANFGITIKNPKPLQKIKDELDDNIDVAKLDKVMNPFKLKNKDLMSSDYNTKLSNSVINYKKYKNYLDGIRLTVIQKDAFPSYANLQLKNVPWIAFLYKDWATAGATCYGFPGFPPFAT